MSPARVIPEDREPMIPTHAFTMNGCSNWDVQDGVPARYVKRALQV